MILIGILAFSLALLCVVAFRYLEHIKNNKGPLWSILRLVSVTFYLIAAMSFGSVLNIPVTDLNLIYEPNDGKSTFEGLDVSFSYLLMALISLGSAWLIEVVFFKRYINQNVTEE